MENQVAVKTKSGDYRIITFIETRSMVPLAYVEKHELQKASAGAKRRHFLQALNRKKDPEEEFHVPINRVRNKKGRKFHRSYKGSPRKCGRIR